jgi:D-glycero-D-manno-heptose 1,7-bisphosphate phosphatase
MIEAVFVDRDGTINVEKGYIYKPEDFELIPGSIDALRLLTRHKIKVFIITNQAGIAKGYYTENQFGYLTEYIMKLFQKEGINIEKTLYCPHHPEGTVPEYTKACNCRKPGTFLLESIMNVNEEKYNQKTLALIGDKNSDIEAGIKLGLTTYLVLTGYGAEHQINTKADYIEPDLLSAVNHLLETNRD